MKMIHMRKQKKPAKTIIIQEFITITKRNQISNDKHILSTKLSIEDYNEG
jgi:hypothetical protein